MDNKVQREMSLRASRYCGAPHARPKVNHDSAGGTLGPNAG